MSEYLDRQVLEKVLPAKVHRSLSNEFIQELNDLFADPDMGETYRDNMITYAHVLNEGRYKIDSYVNAIKFVSHKLRGVSNLEAYICTFPDKYQDLKARGVSDREIHSYVSMYAGGKLVTGILEQSLVPTWLLNQDLYQKALNVQVDLMYNAKSEKVRTDAANSVLNQLKRPEAAKIQLDVVNKEDSAISALKEQMFNLAKQQKEMIESGMVTSKKIAENKIIIEGEYDECD